MFGVVISVDVDVGISVNVGLDRSVDGGSFTARSLSITLTADGTVWHPGDADTGNLRGSRLDAQMRTFCRG